MVYGELRGIASDSYKMHFEILYLNMHAALRGMIEQHFEQA